LSNSGRAGTSISRTSTRGVEHLRAVAIARDHGRQQRKGANTPYVGHLLSVAGLVLENGGTETQAIAALLHDAIEDQSASRGGAEALGAEIERRFGKAACRIVEACTDAWVEPKPPWRERKERYIAHVEHIPKAAVLVSLSDKIHTARAICAGLRVPEIPPAAGCGR
jgi:(p)ppGpp synthase/HD superfamily hydrolase